MKKEFQNSAEKREWLATLLENLAKAVREKRFGEWGNELSAEGYILSDVVDDATGGYEPESL